MQCFAVVMLTCAHAQETAQMAPLRAQEQAEYLARTGR